LSDIKQLPVRSRTSGFWNRGSSEIVFCSPLPFYLSLIHCLNLDGKVKAIRSFLRVTEPRRPWEHPSLVTCCRKSKPLPSSGEDTCPNWRRPCPTCRLDVPPFPSRKALCTPESCKIGVWRS
jgi:hypothetical protein